MVNEAVERSLNNLLQFKEGPIHAMMREAARHAISVEFQKAVLSGKFELKWNDK